MTKLQRVLGLALLLCISASVARAERIGNIQYVKNGDGTITITDYFGYDSILIIPAMIEGMPVTAIGDEAFMQEGRKTITSLTLPASLKTIGDRAFYQTNLITSLTITPNVTSIGVSAFAGCSKLKTLTLGSSLKTIGNYAFSACLALDRLTIPDSVTSIGEQGFQGCTAITSVTIGRGLTSIGYRAFWQCSSLQTFVVHSLNSSFRSDSYGMLYNKSGTTLYLCPGAKAGTVSLLDTVTSIAQYAFAYCANLEIVSCGKNLTFISNYGFYVCSKLTGIYFKGNAPDTDGLYPIAGALNSTVYYYSGTTGWGATYSGRPTVMLKATAIGDTSDPFGLGGDENSDVTISNLHADPVNGFGFTVTVDSEFGRVVIIEACTNLAEGDWVVIGKYTVSDGSIDFIDTEWSQYPKRYYRVK